MAYTDLFEHLDTTIISTFGVPATLCPQSGGQVTIRGVFAPPALMEDLLPGSGTSVIRFFIRYVDVDPLPQHGDTLIIADATGIEISYTVFEVEVDNAGSCQLKLRRNA